jgi:methylmalonyl-CoA/ethylmalonyl-CoA epimerase
VQHVEQVVLGPGELDGLADRVAARDQDPHSAAGDVLDRLVRPPGVPVAHPLDHVGIAVADAEAVAQVFARLLDLDTGAVEVVGAHRLRFVDAGPARLELVEPATADAPVAKFLDRRGDGLHHLCFLVRDIEAALVRLSSAGVRLIDERPRAGAHGSRIAFIHPSSAGGLLIEIKEPAAGPSA